MPDRSAPAPWRGPLSAACPGCGGSDTRPFFALYGAPVNGRATFASTGEACAAPRGDLLLVCCASCGFVFNRAFDPRLVAVGALQAQPPAAPPASYVRALARDWVERHALRGRPVIEVGCGDGTFLSELLRAGAGRAIGVDPLARRCDLAEDLADGVVLEPTAFDERHQALDAAALVCRHTLDQVGDIAGFLGQLAGWAARHPTAAVLVEVPAAEAVFADCAFWELGYERHGYFTEATLAHAARRAGLAVERVSRVQGGRIALIEARGTTAAIPRADLPGARRALSDTIRFGSRARGAIDRCRLHLRQLAGQGPVAVWRADARAVSLLGAVADEELFACAVDLDPRRQGQCLPPHGLPILGPEAMAALRPRHVVAMNPLHLDEVRRALAAAGLPSTQLHVIDRLRDEGPQAGVAAGPLPATIRRPSTVARPPEPAPQRRAAC